MKFSELITMNDESERYSIKDGVEVVFKENPGLLEIGTKEQYTEYIDLIFPESKVKDIYFHGSPNKIEKFLSPQEEGYIKQETTATGVAGIYFTNKSSIAEIYKNIKTPSSASGYLHAVMLDIRKPFIVGNTPLDGVTDGFGATALWNIQSSVLEGLKKAGFDAMQTGEYASRVSPMGENTELAVFSPDQVHILGSGQDIIQFGDFINANQ